MSAASVPQRTSRPRAPPPPHTHAHACMQGPPSPSSLHGHKADHLWSPEQLRVAGVQPKTTTFEDPGLSAGPCSASNIALTPPHKVRLGNACGICCM